MIQLQALRYADYRRLWLGAAFNHQGMSGESVILGLLIYELTGSTAWVGVILAIYFVPMFVFGTLSGAIADWIDRRTLLRRVELGIVVNLCWFAVLLSVDFSQIWLVVLFTLLSGSLRALHQPVRISYAYDIVGGQQVVSGLGLLNLGSRTGQLVGALLAGWVMHRFGAPAALFVLAVGHVFAFTMFAQLQLAGDSAAKEHAPIAQNLREFVFELRSNRILLMLLLVTSTVEIFGFSFATGLPELATTRLNLGAEGLGYLHAARATGGIVAGLAMTFLGQMQGRGLAYLGVIFGFGLSLIFLAAESAPLLTIAAVGFVSLMAATSDVLTQSMMQLSVANALRGRAMGVWVLAVGFGPIGHLQLGFASVLLGLSGALALNGAMLVVIGLVVVFAAPKLRQL